MATKTDTKRPAKTNFADMAQAKRRRVRSGGSQSTNNTGAQLDHEEDDDFSDEKTAQTSKCKGTTTIPIFLKKTYKMIDTCDDNIAAWTPDGEMFVVKDPDLFASNIIPQYFDHNKFSSFARQLNFYGFRKMQSKPIRNSDFDSNTAKHVTFFNENFKRGRCDLLKKIQRSTRGGGTSTAQDHQREVQNLKEQVTTLENKVSEMSQQFEERMRRLELDMLGRMEQMMLAMAQQQQAQSHAQVGTAGANGTANGSTQGAAVGAHSLRGASTGESWEPLPYARGLSITASNYSGPASQAGTAAAAAATANGGSSSDRAGGSKSSGTGGPTLPPHPKQKPMPPTLPPHPKQKGNGPSMPSNGLPNHMSFPPSRLSSLARGLSRGISNLSRGASIESQLRNTWEDKFFSMLMLGENDAAAAAAAQNAMAQNMAALGQQGYGGASGSGQAPSGQNGLNGLSALADRSFLSQFGGQLPRLSSEMSSMSTSATLGQR